MKIIRTYKHLIILEEGVKNIQCRIIMVRNLNYNKRYTILAIKNNSFHIKNLFQNNSGYGDGKINGAVS